MLTRTALIFLFTLASFTTFAQIDDPKVPLEESFITAKQYPEFPGGPEKLKAYLQRSTGYARRKGNIPVDVEFTVLSTGKIDTSSIFVHTQLASSCTKKLKAAIQRMPAWKPGKINGVTKDAKTTIKVLVPKKCINYHTSRP